jgi:hypothetical protein
VGHRQLRKLGSPLRPLASNQSKIQLLQKYVSLHVHPYGAMSLNSSSAFSIMQIAQLFIFIFFKKKILFFFSLQEMKFYG